MSIIWAFQPVSLTKALMRGCVMRSCITQHRVTRRVIKLLHESYLQHTLIGSEKPITVIHCYSRKNGHFQKKIWTLSLNQIFALVVAFSKKIWTHPWNEISSHITTDSGKDKKIHFFWFSVVIHHMSPNAIGESVMRFHIFNIVFNKPSLTIITTSPPLMFIIITITITIAVTWQCCRCQRR